MSTDYSGGPRAWRGQPTATPQDKPVRRSGRVVWIILGCVVALLVGFGIGSFAVYQIGAQAAQAPVVAANSFCSALKTQNYSAVYNMLSFGYQGRTPIDTFKQSAQLHDQLDGKVKECRLASVASAGGFQVDLSPSRASFMAQIARNKTFSGTISLVKEGEAWKIDSVDDTLQGSDLGPLTTANHFCDALLKKDFNGAYGDLSSAQQRTVGSAKDYGTNFQQQFGGGQTSFAGCELRYDTYSITAAGDAASLDVEAKVQITAATGKQTVAVPLKFTFAKQSGAWKIAGFSVLPK